MKFPLKIIIAVLFVSTAAICQEKCETTNDNLSEDLNSISITKCSIEDVKKSLESDNKQLSLRKHVRKSKKKNISIDISNKVKKIKSKNLLVQKLEIQNDVVSSLKKVPFHLVEQIPLFSKCKNEPLLKQSKCFENYMIRHVVKNFNYPKQALLKGIEGKVLVQFTINTDGEVVDIKKRGPKNGALLEQEANRLIAKLPPFIPGKHKGNLVNVKYALPIIFKTPKKS